MGEQTTVFDLLGIQDDFAEMRSLKEQKKVMKEKYNHYEIMSALHKNIRKGDPVQSVFWANMLAGGSTPWFPLRYLYTIVGEETSSMELHSFIGEAFTNYKSLTEKEFTQAVATFALYPHKKHTTRYNDLSYHYLSRNWNVSKSNKDYSVIIKPAYRKASKEYLDKWEEILGVEDFSEDYKVHEVMAGYEEGIDTKDFEMMQYYNCLFSPKSIEKYFMEGLGELVKKSERTERYWKNSLKSNVREYINAYSTEMIALHLMGSGEVIVDDIYLVEGEELDKIHEEVMSLITGGEIIPIPEYAHDTHTRKGKKVWYKTRRQFMNGKPYELDLRYSSMWVAWMWRRNALKQFGRIDVPWEDVEMDNDKFFTGKVENVYHALDSWEDKK